MTRSHTFTAGVLLVALASTTAACSTTEGNASSSQPSASSTSAAPTPSPTPSATETQLSRAQKDAKAAQQAVVALWEEVDRYSSHPNTDVSNLVEVARGETVDVWRQMIIRQRAQHYLQKGATRVESVEATANTEGRWNAVACIDVSSVNVVDQNGQSVVNPDGPSRIQYEYVLEKDGERFYVLRDEAVSEC